MSTKVRSRVRRREKELQKYGKKAKKGKTYIIGEKKKLRKGNPKFKSRFAVKKRKKRNRIRGLPARQDYIYNFRFKSTFVITLKVAYTNKV